MSVGARTAARSLPARSTRPPRHDRSHLRCRVGCRAQRGTGPRACPEVPDGERRERGLFDEPFGRGPEPGGEQVDVEHVVAVALFLSGEQIEEQRCELRVVEHFRDVLVPCAVPAAPTPVGEHHDAAGIGWHREVARHRNRSGAHDHLFITARIPSLTRVGIRSRVMGRKLGEEIGNLVVRHLREVVVPLADAEEVRRRLEAHDLVGMRGELSHRVGRCNGHGQNDATRPMGARHLERSARRAARGEPVVDDDDRPVLEAEHVALAPESARPAFELGSLAHFDGRDLLGADTCHPDHVVVEHTCPALADGAHPELGLARHPELADDDHIERCAERASDLGRHRHAAARQREHDRVLAPEVLETRRQLASRSAAVTKAHAPSMPGRDPAEKGRRTHVLVQVEQVARVVFRLDRREAAVVVLVVLLHATFVVAGHEVDVAAGQGVGLEGLVVVLDPRDVLVVVGGVRPHAGDHRRELGVAVRERGCVRTRLQAPLIG